MNHKETKKEWKERHSSGVRARATTWSRNKKHDKKNRRNEGKKICNNY